MEDALRVEEALEKARKVVSSLNPCSNGRCSASMSNPRGLRNNNPVLILVLMEDPLRVQKYADDNNVGSSLNPCSNGRCSASS